MIGADHVSCRAFIMQLNKQASRCSYSDRLEEQMCDRINNLTLQRKLLEKKDLTFADARKICEQHVELMKATSSESVTLFQRQMTRPNRPPLPTSVPKPQHDSSSNGKRINPFKQPRCSLAQPAANDTNLVLSLRSESQSTQFLYTDVTFHSAQGTNSLLIR
ncbi:unnamed protein product [Echinostoma caproni]|uniref:Uncharacterized protein n=1 Tax=Echinostoma caproni TaxID=27848 RepID=A0A183BF29_9TREM|nr:unnamed protein product [Echinostoma caproni]